MIPAAMDQKPKNPRAWHQLRSMRRRAKLSQDKLGAEVGLTQGMISQLESGESDYTRSHIDALSKFFNVDPAELVGDVATGEEVYRMLRELPDTERPRAVEILKALRRTAEGA